MYEIDIYSQPNKGGTRYRLKVGTVVHKTGDNTDTPTTQYYQGVEDPTVTRGTDIFSWLFSIFGMTNGVHRFYLDSNDYWEFDCYFNQSTPYMVWTISFSGFSSGFYYDQGYGVYLARVTNSPVSQSYSFVIENLESVAGDWFYRFSNYNDELIRLSDIGAFDPYKPGGYAGPGGGEDGNFSEASDSVSEDLMPDETSIGAVGSGFSTIFSPTKAQLVRLSEVFWGTTVVGFFQNMVENISEMFVSLGIVPFIVPKGSTISVQWFNLIDTAISLTLAQKQFIEFDMGSINLATNVNAFSSDTVLDYSPYSKLGIYLPFIGYQELNIDECRGCVVNLIYRIDILSGSCVALIKINGNTIYQFSGNCLTQIPLTAQDMSSLFTNAVQVGIAATNVGMAGAVASAGDAYGAEKYMEGSLSAAGAESLAAQHAASVSSAKGALASASANAAMGIKPSYKKSGAVSASCSLLSVKQPYLFLTTPRQSYPENYGHYCGFPSNITGKLGSFEGFTVVEDIRLNGLVATSPEVEEIYKLLKSGVII